MFLKYEFASASSVSVGPVSAMECMDAAVESVAAFGRVESALMKAEALALISNESTGSSFKEKVVAAWNWLVEKVKKAFNYIVNFIKTIINKIKSFFGFGAGDNSTLERLTRMHTELTTGKKREFKDAEKVEVIKGLSGISAKLDTAQSAEAKFIAEQEGRLMKLISLSDKLEGISGSSTDGINAIKTEVNKAKEEHNKDTSIREMVWGKDYKDDKEKVDPSLEAFMANYDLYMKQKAFVTGAEESQKSIEHMLKSAGEIAMKKGDSYAAQLKGQAAGGDKQEEAQSKLKTWMDALKAVQDVVTKSTSGLGSVISEVNSLLGKIVSNCSAIYGASKPVKKADGKAGESADFLLGW